VAGNVLKVVVACEHRQVMTDAKLSQQGIDCSDLYPGTATAISQLRGPDMIVSIRNQ
jgi:hypothetical protein